MLFRQVEYKSEYKVLFFVAMLMHLYTAVTFSQIINILFTSQAVQLRHGMLFSSSAFNVLFHDKLGLGMIKK